MNTSVSQLELRGMVAGDDARAEDLAPANGDAASAGQVCPRESHRDEIGSRASATEKSKTKRNADEAGAVEERRVTQLLRQLKLEGHPDIILIDARADNKPSGSKAA